MSKAIVLLSGGQDSTTCLFWSLKKFEHVEALFINYGQRHIIEEQSAEKIASLANVKLHKIKTDVLKQIGNSALVGSKSKIDQQHQSNKNLPASFVPGRNIYFLTVTAALAYKLDISNIVTGTCQTDFSGYPDCRDETIRSAQHTLNLGMEGDFKIHTPLMFLTKAESVHLASKLEGCMNALRYSQTCYEGERPPCGKCPSCILRKKGFDEAGVEDPIFEN